MILQVFFILLLNFYLVYTQTGIFSRTENKTVSYIYPEDVYAEQDRFTIDYVLQTVSWPFVPDYVSDNITGLTNSNIVNQTTTVQEKSFRKLILETFKESSLKQFRTVNKTLHDLGFSSGEDNPDVILNWYLSELNKTGHGIILIRRPDNNTKMIRGKELEAVLLEFLKQGVSSWNETHERLVEIQFTRYNPDPTTEFSTWIPVETKKTRNYIYTSRITKSTSSTYSTVGTKFFKVYQKPPSKPTPRTKNIQPVTEAQHLPIDRSSLYEQFRKWQQTQKGTTEPINNNFGRKGQHYAPPNYGQFAPNYGQAVPNYGQGSINYVRTGPDGPSPDYPKGQDYWASNYGQGIPNRQPPSNYGQQNGPQNIGQYAPNYDHGVPNYDQRVEANKQPPPNYAQQDTAQNFGQYSANYGQLPYKVLSYGQRIPNNRPGVPYYGQDIQNRQVTLYYGASQNVGQRFPNYGQGFQKGVEVRNYDQASPIVTQRPASYVQDAQNAYKPNYSLVQNVEQKVATYNQVTQNAVPILNYNQIPQNIKQEIPSYAQEIQNNAQVSQNTEQRIDNVGQRLENVEKGPQDIQQGKQNVESPQNIGQENSNFGGVPQTVRQIPANIAQEQIISMFDGYNLVTQSINPGLLYGTHIPIDHDLSKTGHIQDPRLTEPNHGPTSTKATLGVPEALKMIAANTRGLQFMNIDNMLTKNTDEVLRSPGTYTQNLLVYPEDLLTKYTILDYTRQRPGEPGGPESPARQVDEPTGEKSKASEVFAVGDIVLGVKTTPLTTTPSAFVKELNKDMEISKNGYYTTFLIKLLEMVASCKNKTALTKFFFSAEPVVEQMLMQAEFYRYGEPFSSRFLDQARALNGAPIDVTQSLAAMSYNYMVNRKKVGAADINTIFDYLDGNIKENEGKALFVILEEVKLFPNISKKPKELMRNLLSAAFEPTKRLTMTNEGRAFFDTVNKAIADRTGDRIFPRAISDINTTIQIRNDIKRRWYSEKVTNIETDKEYTLDKPPKKRKAYKRGTSKEIMKEAKRYLKNKHPDRYKIQLKDVRQQIPQRITKKKNRNRILKKIGIERRGYNYERYLKMARKEKIALKDVYNTTLQRIANTFKKGEKRLNVVLKRRKKNESADREKKTKKEADIYINKKNKQETHVTTKYIDTNYNKNLDPASIKIQKTISLNNRATIKSKTKYFTYTIENFVKPADINTCSKNNKFNLTRTSNKFRKPMSLVNEFVRRFAREHKKREESSYTDDERDLKINLKAALIHGNRNFDNLRRNIKVEKELSSDEEIVLKNNIYKSFGFTQRDT
ncbi:hypothetical protein K1T71_000580 [Dendrolimus kikuchii]|uniref:Uncharacterized protein n=1 Tax=Dendrolimus kikuchii TaxID=765133 RepID=A0ACC1DJS6_9NEOP|nr:hypothetical protein K1T71_000580 [Dendrolimus kikuchii]